MFLFVKIGFKMNVDELINKSQSNNINYLPNKTTELSNELLETLKMIGNCIKIIMQS